jgi:LacI family transcriptional regulator
VRHVAILIETSRAYGRGLARGIARDHPGRGTWSTYFRPQGLGLGLRLRLGAPAPPWLATWKSDGILARINDRMLASAWEY